MRIVVDDIAASKTGALSVLRDFYKYIDENDRDNDWIFVLGDKLLEDKERIKVIVRDDVKSSRKNRLMFDLKTGAKYFEELKPDVLFSLQNTLPSGYKGRQVLYVHQPLPYQTWKRFSFFKPEEREYAVYQQLIGRMINASVKRADRVIVQTEWMREAVIKKTGISPDKIVKILPDIRIPSETTETGDGSLSPKRMTGDREPSPVSAVSKFFYPAGEILYKNHSCILEAVGILKDRGIDDFEVAFTLKRGDIPSLSRYPDHEQVKYLGRISRDEVFERYRKEILLFPSYIETFGYPPAEARAVGGRMIASDCPFCHEILDGYKKAVFFDPFDPAALADLMEGALKGELFKAEDDACEGKYEKAETKSWEKVVKEILGTA